MLQIKHAIENLENLLDAVRSGKIEDAERTVKNLLDVLQQQSCKASSPALDLPFVSLPELLKELAEACPRGDEQKSKIQLFKEFPEELLNEVAKEQEEREAYGMQAVACMADIPNLQAALLSNEPILVLKAVKKYITEQRGEIIAKVASTEMRLGEGLCDLFSLDNGLRRNWKKAQRALAQGSQSMIACYFFLLADSLMQWVYRKDLAVAEQKYAARFSRIKGHRGIQVDACRAGEEAERVALQSGLPGSEAKTARINKMIAVYTNAKLSLSRSKASKLFSKYKTGKLPFVER